MSTKYIALLTIENSGLIGKEKPVWEGEIQHSGEPPAVIVWYETDTPTYFRLAYTRNVEDAENIAGKVVHYYRQCTGHTL